MGISVMGCVVYAKKAQFYNYKDNTAEDKKLVGKYMKLHKSFGLLAAGLLFPRLLIRMSASKAGKIPAAVEGPMVQKALA